jgi:hypothetical protein
MVQTNMGQIRAQFIPKFYMGEDDAVLVSLDREGVAELEAAIRRASQAGGSPDVLRADGTTHRFEVKQGARAIAFRDREVVWQLSRELMQELADKLSSMRACPRPCHNYIDIASPAELLILSVDEYPGPLA